ncbi:PTS mannose/fructose/sorbose transporter subunit IIC [Citrobacter sp. ESY80]|uniref:PTS mannose/fructose/sorbose transporter subunit IIC n=2 Tax=Citrobacter braakii TaxID=57706 RepID=UPI000E1496F2|nr:PTS mannose/fructose/sorbose transporter subunit IIC [Citrobacter braakii]QXA94172.1 PTS mannose/fructose/sorbose transporter subunit IIC [Citrobacter braakii]STB40339.1 mannose-specific PTS system EIIC component [Citrobacter braakii]SUX59703.1 mannose-specific PTS system EIIC component [Citrobacter braakii]HCZ8663093.1 PTS mannose/fructose/sorbose transporter subunit IIC [Citrobacter braakii]
MDTLQIIALVIIAAVAGMGSVLDEGQTHRPLIACTLVGIVLGDITTGVILGGTLEMMALGWMNVGLAMAPDTAIASVIATILVITTGQGIGEGIAIAVALAAAGQVLTIFIRTITVFFIHRADKYAEQGSTRGIEIMHVSALLLQGLRVALPTLAVLMMSVDTVQAILSNIPHVVTRGLQIGGGIVVVVGYAMVINMMNVKYLMPFFFGGFLLAAFTGFNLVGFGGMGLVIALLWMQIHPKYQNQKATATAGTPASSADDDDLDI